MAVDIDVKGPHMLEMSLMYPAAGLATLVGSVAGLKALDHLVEKIPAWMVTAAARRARRTAAAILANHSRSGKSPG